MRRIVSHQMLSLSHLCFGSLDRITHHLEEVMIHQGHLAHPLRIGTCPTPRPLQSDRACPRLGLVVKQYGYPTCTRKKLHSHFTNNIFKPELSPFTVASGQRSSVTTSYVFLRSPRRRLRHRRLNCTSNTLPPRIGIISQEKHFEMSSTHVFRVKVCFTQSPSPVLRSL